MLLNVKGGVGGGGGVRGGFIDLHFIAVLYKLIDIHINSL